jgi:hypothetical protein
VPESDGGRRLGGGRNGLVGERVWSEGVLDYGEIDDESVSVNRLQHFNSLLQSCFLEEVHILLAT